MWLLAFSTPALSRELPYGGQYQLSGLLLGGQTRCCRPLAGLGCPRRAACDALRLKVRRELDGIRIWSRCFQSRFISTKKHRVFALLSSGLESSELFGITSIAVRRKVSVFLRALWKSQFAKLGDPELSARAKARDNGSGSARQQAGVANV